jgi:hypothetical protein
MIMNVPRYAPRAAAASPPHVPPPPVPPARPRSLPAAPECRMPTAAKQQHAALPRPRTAHHVCVGAAPRPQPHLRPHTGPLPPPSTHGCVKCWSAEYYPNNKPHARATRAQLPRRRCGPLASSVTIALAAP